MCSTRDSSSPLSSLATFKLMMLMSRATLNLLESVKRCGKTGSGRGCRFASSSSPSPSSPRSCSITTSPSAGWENLPSREWWSGQNTKKEGCDNFTRTFCSARLPMFFRWTIKCTTCPQRRAVGKDGMSTVMRGIGGQTRMDRHMLSSYTTPFLWAFVELRRRGLRAKSRLPNTSPQRQHTKLLMTSRPCLRGVKVNFTFCVALGANSRANGVDLYSGSWSSEPSLETSDSVTVPDGEMCSQDSCTCVSWTGICNGFLTVTSTWIDSPTAATCSRLVFRWVVRRRRLRTWPVVKSSSISRHSIDESKSCTSFPMSFKKTFTLSLSIRGRGRSMSTWSSLRPITFR
mmetsp:Transcript_30537/g.76623  ORF Transcript_30537/g.76623 Transcript_30537/m.76623 type:complete len:345 (-) Transcript_30537:1771-2805(-)